VYHELGVTLFFIGMHVGRVPRKCRYDTEKRFYMAKSGDFVDRVSKKTLAEKCTYDLGGQ